MTNPNSVGITVNGEDHCFEQAPTVAELLTRLGLPDKGIAIAVDGAVFPRGTLVRAGRKAGRSRFSRRFKVADLRDPAQTCLG